MTCRILLADDHKVVRDGLKALIGKEAGMEVVAEAATGRKAWQLSKKTNPDVVIMDVSMPELNGMDATRQILNDVPQVKVVALSMHSQHQFVEGMLNAGVSAFLLKDSAFEELPEAIRVVAAGSCYLIPLFNRGYAGSHSILGQVGYGVETELVHDAASVGFHGLDADVEPGGNLFRGVSLSDQLKYFSLTLG